MIRRLLDRMGLSGYLPGANDVGFDNRNTDAPDAPLGEAHITFLGGAKTPFTPEEAAQQEGSEDNQSGLVWPGKPTTIGLRNEEPLAYRYNLTVTNLPADHYIVLPPTGGTRQPEGGTLLQPGEETVFEVRFPPVAREQMPPQSFHFVLTRFDPRRRNDPGVVVGEDAARWVPLPSGSDFLLRANTDKLRLRPWRRNATFLLSVDDRSFLASTAQLHILRAPTRQTLAEQAEQVETISQALPARTSGTWRCELPPSQLRTSCWVTARGVVRVGEHQAVPVALPKPIYVRYVPWLHMGRDWMFLGTTLMALLWVVWGIPVRKAPIIHMSLKFGDLEEGKLPDRGSWDDLTLQIVSIDNKKLATPIPGVNKNNQFVFEDFPRKLYGYRWPFHSWSSWGPAPRKIRVEAIVPNEGNRDIYAKYDLMPLKSQENDPKSFSIPAASRPFLGDWVLTPTAVARVTNGIRLNVDLPGTSRLREASQTAHEVKITATLGGVKVLEEPNTLSRDEKQIFVYDLDSNIKRMGIRRSGVLEVRAIVGDNESDPWQQEVQPRQASYDVHLKFPEPPKVNTVTGPFKSDGPITVTGERLRNSGKAWIKDNPATVLSWSPALVKFSIPSGTLTGQVPVEIQPQGYPQRIPAGMVTIGEMNPISKVSPPTRDPHPDKRELPKQPETETGKKFPALPDPAHPVTLPITSGETKPAEPGPKIPVPRPNQTPVASNADLSGFSPYELVVMGKTDEAAPHVDAMLQAKRADANTMAIYHALKGMIYLQQDSLEAAGEINKAVNFAQKLSRGRGCALAYLSKARLDWKLNAPREQVIGSFEAAIQADHKLEAAWAGKAMYCYKNNDEPQAEQLYTYGLMDNPHSALYHYLFARVYLEKGDTAKEQEQLKLMRSAERNAKRRNVFNALVSSLTDS